MEATDPSADLPTAESLTVGSAGRPDDNGAAANPTVEHSHFRKSLATLCKARFPLIMVETWEEERVHDEIRAVASDEDLIRTPRALKTWSLTRGLTITDAKGGSSSQKQQSAATPSARAISALAAIEADDAAAIYVLKDFHVFFGTAHSPGDPEVIRRLRDLSAALKLSAKPKNIVFVSPVPTIPVELEKDVVKLDFDLPTEAELGACLREMIEANQAGGRITIDLDEKEEIELVRAALGLTQKEAENAFARAMVEDGRLDASDVAQIIAEKQQIIKQTEILEFIPTGPSFSDVGGLENLKRWLNRRDRSWSESAKEYGLPFPKGVLITGVPGCGKSLSAKCTGELWRMPILRLDVGRVFAGLVGSSEQNMRKALRTAEAIAPSILWIDELEKGFAGAAGGGGDSGTAQRVFGTFLTWMQEKEKPVFVVATANDIAGLPAEFLRKGRFDEVFFVDLPTRAERIPIWKVHLTKRLITESAKGNLVLEDQLFADLADASEGYAGAEIEQAVVAALFEAHAERRGLTRDDLMAAIGNMVPLSVTQSEKIGALRTWAASRAVAATPNDDRTGYSATATDLRPAPPTPMERGGRAVDF